MFQCHIHDHWGELWCPSLKTMCYVAINCGLYNSYVIIYKRYNCAYTGVTQFIQ